MLYRKISSWRLHPQSKCGRVSFKINAEYAWEISNGTLWRHTGKWRLFNARNWGSLKASQFPEISLRILSTAFRVPLCDWLPVICVLLLGQLFCIYILFQVSRQFFRQVLPVFFSLLVSKLFSACSLIEHRHVKRLFQIITAVCAIWKCVILSVWYLSPPKLFQRLSLRCNWSLIESWFDWLTRLWSGERMNWNGEEVACKRKARKKKKETHVWCQNLILL